MFLHIIILQKKRKIYYFYRRYLNEEYSIFWILLRHIFYVKKTIRKKIVLTEEQLQRADANGDGKVNAGDYVTILNIVRGKI